MSNVIHLSSGDFEASTNGKLCLIDFYADWCGPCKMFAPILDQIAQETEGKVFVAKVNVTNEPDLAVRFGVQSIPTVLILKNGAEIKRFIGVQDKAIVLQSLKDAE